MQDENVTIAEVVEEAVSQDVQEPVSETPEGEQQEDTPADKIDEQKEEQHKESRIQKRIDKLTREKYELKGRVEAMERMLMQNQQSAQPQDSKPTRDQYQSDEDFVEAMVDWKEAKREAAAPKPFNTSWQAKVIAARKEYNDYDDVLSDIGDIVLPPAANEALMTSDYGADIVYYLGQNPEEALKLSQLPQGAAARMIGQIESRIEATKKAKAQQEPKKQTSAPKPPPTVKPGGAPKIDLTGEGASKLTADEWRKAREAEIAAKRKR